MRQLVIETATTATSVALFDDGRLLANQRTAAARGSAERLLPMIAALPEGGRADAVLVDCGPGSFTGIRVGLSAARGLGFAWRVPVHGYSSLALIAASWLALHDGPEIGVVIEGGHGEVFVERFAGHPLRSLAAFRSVPTAAFAERGGLLIGNAADRFATVAPDWDITPDAANVAVLSLPLLEPRPLYGRGADAKPMA